MKQPISLSAMIAFFTALILAEIGGEIPNNLAIFSLGVSAGLGMVLFFYDKFHPKQIENKNDITPIDI